MPGKLKEWIVTETDCLKAVAVEIYHAGNCKLVDRCADQRFYIYA